MLVSEEVTQVTLDVVVVEQPSTAASVLLPRLWEAAAATWAARHEAKNLKNCCVRLLIHNCNEVEDKKAKILK